jgi:hypothetical protein
VSPRTANTNDVRATIQRRIQRHYNYVR